MTTATDRTDALAERLFTRRSVRWSSAAVDLAGEAFITGCAEVAS
jgi:hypothetical protein